MNIPHIQSFKTYKSLSLIISRSLIIVKVKVVQYERTIYPFPRDTIMQARVENNNEIAWLQMAGYQWWCLFSGSINFSLLFFFLLSVYFSRLHPNYFSLCRDKDLSTIDIIHPKMFIHIQYLFISFNLYQVQFKHNINTSSNK